MNSKKWIAALLCLALLFGLCATAMAEGKKADEEDVDEIVEEVVRNTADMTDEEIREAFRAAAQEKGFKLTEKQLDSLLKLCRSTEGLNEKELNKRAETIGEEFERFLTETPEKFLKWIEDIEDGRYTWEDARNDVFTGIGSAAGAISGFFGGIANFFNSGTGSGTRK